MSPEESAPMPPMRLVGKLLDLLVCSWRGHWAPVLPEDGWPEDGWRACRTCGRAFKP